MPRIEIIIGRSESLIEACRSVRRIVFIEEQDVPEDIEIDDLDPVSDHILLILEGEPVATARVRSSGRKIKIERFAVLREHRSKGYGTAIMERILKQYGNPSHDEMVISSQTRVIGFYTMFGFMERGGIYLDADIPHRELYRTIEKV